MTEITITLDEIDYRLLEGCLDNMRKILSQDKLRIEDAATFCVKKFIYSQGEDSKTIGH